MGKIRSGILGQLRGKVAGVVGGQWKNVNYVREYIVPANPNTAAQQVQRGKFGRAVDFAKPLVGPVFNAYTDQFQKAMSGFNFFIKSNIALFLDPPTFEDIVVTSGKLFHVVPITVAMQAAQNKITFEWEEDIGSNGALTDSVFAVALNETTGRWGFMAAEKTRDDGAVGDEIAFEVTAGDVGSLWIWGIKKVGTQIVEISDSAYATHTAV